MTTTPSPWMCAVCGARYVVPSLARSCETKHQTTTEGDDR